MFLQLKPVQGHPRWVSTEQRAPVLCFLFSRRIHVLSTRRAPHSSVPCHTADWGHLHQAFSDARERCQHLYCLLLGTAILLLAVLEGDPELAYDWITANSSCFGRVKALLYVKFSAEAYLTVGLLFLEVLLDASSVHPLFRTVCSLQPCCGVPKALSVLSLTSKALRESTSLSNSSVLRRGLYVEG
jgi:hypothetical protein